MRKRRKIISSNGKSNGLDQNKPANEDAADQGGSSPNEEPACSQWKVRLVKETSCGQGSSPEITPPGGDPPQVEQGPLPRAFSCRQRSSTVVTRHRSNTEHFHVSSHGSSALFGDVLVSMGIGRCSRQSCWRGARMGAVVILAILLEGS